MTFEKLISGTKISQIRLFRFHGSAFFESYSPIELLRVLGAKALTSRLRGPSYQTSMNRALRTYVGFSKREALKKNKQHAVT